MKALVLTAAIAAAVAVTAPAALAKQQGYRYSGDTLSTELKPAPAQGINITTDTLGGTGQAATDTRGNPIAANDERHFGPGWRPSTGQPGSSGSESLPFAYGGPSTVVDTSPSTAQPSTKPYIYGGAPPAVAQAGSGFYRAYLSPPRVTTTGGDGFNWGDAGLGAVTGFAALFLFAGSAMLVRRRTTLAV